MCCISISEFSAYLGQDFFKICDLNSLMIFPKSTKDFMMKRNVRKMIKTNKLALIT